MTDKQKVKRGIEQCFMSYVKEEYETQCWDCPYFSPEVTVDQCRGELKEDILKLLKEQEEEQEENYAQGYRNGRRDEAGLRDGTILQMFSP